MMVVVNGNGTGINNTDGEDCSDVRAWYDDYSEKRETETVKK